MSANLAILTSENLPDIESEDQRLVNELELLGFKVRYQVWDDPQLLEDPPDLVLIRSTWDYHKRVHKFVMVMQKLEQLGVVVKNSALLVEWNSDKFYLNELQKKGVEIVPTEFFHWETPERVDACFDFFGVSELVIKPRISASAHNTFRVHRSQWNQVQGTVQDEIHRSLLGYDVMVQPFLEEIQTEGEWSLVYIDGHFSHGVLKTPKQGDFRVQQEYGGETIAKEPDSELLKLALETLNQLDETPLYARVDVVRTPKGPMLIELELIEPYLFLNYAEESFGKLVSSLEAFLHHDRSRFSREKDILKLVRYVKNTHGKGRSRLSYSLEFLRVYYYGKWIKHSFIGQWVEESKYKIIAWYSDLKAWYLLNLHWRLAKYFSGDMFYHWCKQHIVWRVAFILSGAFFRRLMGRGSKEK